MEFDSIINKRKSVRSFKKKSASWKDVLEAIDSASQAPFAGNLNNLKFMLVENQEKIKALAKLSSQSWVAEAGIVVVVCSDDRNLENMYGDRGRVYSRQQAGAAIQNLLLKLVDLGLSGCWVGAYSDELIRNLLKIPSHIQIEAIVPVGYEAPAPGSKNKKKKKPLDQIIFWDSWGMRDRPHKIQDPEMLYKEHN